MDKEPTEAQIKEFWERCGFKLKPNAVSFGTIDWPDYVWHDGDGNARPDEGLPPIDLNNLFKYAVPKAIDKIMAGQECSSDLAYAILFKKWLQKLELDIPNHEGTLFDTIWEVING